MLSLKVRLFVLAACASLMFAAMSIAEPATVIKNDGTCLMAGADENGAPILGLFGQIVTLVENDNKAMIACQGNVPNDSGKETGFSGFPCWIDDPHGGDPFLTFDSKTIIAPNGNATLMCTFKKSRK
jgi:hypothetical protein